MIQHARTRRLARYALSRRSLAALCAGLVLVLVLALGVTACATHDRPQTDSYKTSSGTVRPSSGEMKVSGEFKASGVTINR